MMDDRRFLVFVVLVLLPAQLAAQSWNGTFALTALGGSRSNLYLEDNLGVWNRQITPSFGGVRPTGQVRWTYESFSVAGGGGGRFDYVSGTEALPRSFYAYGLTSYSAGRSFKVGLQGGANRYDFIQERATSWILPYVEWSPGLLSSLTLNLGTTGQTIQDSAGSVLTQQQSLLASLRGRWWMTDRVRTGFRLYHTASEAVTRQTRYGGTGGVVSAKFLLTDNFSLSVETSLERVSYEFQRQSGGGIAGGGGQTFRQSDVLVGGEGRVGRQIGQNVSVFLEAQVLRSALGGGEPMFDSRIAGGVQYNFQWSSGSSVLGRLSPSRSLWDREGEQMLFEICTPDSGSVYITGDFNDWGQPGLQLQKVGSCYARSLTLEPGRYEYRVLVIVDGERRWLELPDYAQTVADGFGGQNGLLQVD